MRLTLEQMEKLTTKRLLAYKKKYNRTAYYSRSSEEYERCSGPKCRCEYCKSERDRFGHLKEIKSVLATREHVEK